MSKKYSLTTTLVIVESPAKCKKIESYLGPGYKCLASFGHLRELPSLKNIDIENYFHANYTVIDNAIKKKQIALLKTEIANAGDVILATDDDREGEAIAWHICILFNLSVERTKRMVFHEITETAILASLKNMRTINMNIVHAQQSRQILDLLVGFKISPLLWEYITRNAENSLSAGRCQTPALKLVYENQMECDTHPGKKIYNTIGYFTNQSIPFDLSKHFENEDAMVDFLEKSTDHKHIFTRSEPVKVFKKPPEPFTTSRLQQTSSNELHISPKETMKLCQTLYENGYITYMRTDSKTYGKEFIESSKKYISKNYEPRYINEKIDDLNGIEIKKNPSKKAVLAQEAHEAIRPTDIHLKDLPDKMEPREKRLYKLIWENTLESCMSPASFYSITATISSVGDAKYTFTSELVDFLGWKIVALNKNGMENKEYNFLLALKQNLIMPYKKIISKAGMTNTKMHYTEAKLVQLLEENGIGRPSTFSTLIDKIQERGYVKKMDVQGKTMNCSDYELENGDIFEVETTREYGNEKNKLLIQPIGVLVLQFLDKHFNKLFDYEYTKCMEDDLDKIANGNQKWTESCKQCLSEINELIQNLKNNGEGKQEIKIDETHTYIMGKHGPVIKCVFDGQTVFKPVKKDINIAALQSGQYKVEDIIDVALKNEFDIGEYNGERVILGKGKFGLYVTWGKNLSKSLKCFGNRPIENIKLEDVIKFIEKEGNIVREVNDNITIRNGKFGDYVFYKNDKMKKPQFISLNEFNGDYKTCDLDVLKQWLLERYKAY